MGSKSVSFDEFYNRTVDVKGRGYVTGTGGGLTEAVAVKVSDLPVTKQPVTGLTDQEMIGKPYQDCDWFFGCFSKPSGVLNGDILVDDEGEYSIQYMEKIDTHLGGYFAMWCKEVRE